MKHWYKNIGANDNNSESESQQTGGIAYSASDMRNLSRLAKRVRYNSFTGTATSSMVKYGTIGAGCGLLAGILAKKNIVLFVLAGTGLGSIAGYVIDIAADVKEEKELSNINKNQED